MSGPPAADVFECADGYIFRVELAGVGLDHVRVEVHEGILHVSGERPFPQSQGEYYALELSYGPFFAHLCPAFGRGPGTHFRQAQERPC